MCGCAWRAVTCLFCYGPPGCLGGGLVCALSWACVLSVVRCSCVLRGLRCVRNFFACLACFAECVCVVAASYCEQLVQWGVVLRGRRWCVACRACVRRVFFFLGFELVCAAGACVPFPWFRFSCGTSWLVCPLVGCYYRRCTLGL